MSQSTACSGLVKELSLVAPAPQYWLLRGGAGARIVNLQYAIEHSEGVGHTAATELPASVLKVAPFIVM